MLKSVKNRYYVLKKRLTAKQVGKFEDAKKTYPNLKLIDHNEFVQLFNPDLFPEINKHRLYRAVSKKILQSFSDFHYGFSRLPDSYKAKILTSRDFHDFMSQVEQYAKIVDTKKKESPEKLFSYIMYYNFFRMGIEGLMETMPEEFKYHVREKIRESLFLMQSIANYSKKSNPKSKIPFISAPRTIQNLGTADYLR